jgi:hypothetical protein
MILVESNHKLPVEGLPLRSVSQVIPAFHNTWILAIELLDHTRIVHVDSKGLLLLSVKIPSFPNVRILNDHTFIRIFELMYKTYRHL